MKLFLTYDEYSILVNTPQAYQTLKVKKDAPFDEVKTAYRKLALELHPDKNQSDDEGKKFKVISEAYQQLKQEHKKGKKNGFSNQKYKRADKTNQNFRKKNTQWGAPPGGRTPEEDWSRFTKDFEESNPSFWKEYEKKFWEQYNAHIYGNQDDEEFEKTKEPDNPPNLFVDVDQSLCIGCCSCEIIAPDVFEINKLSRMNPKSRVINQRGAGFNTIMNAAQTCPTKAINVEDTDKKERLYPI